MQLGLLFGHEDSAEIEDLPEALSFQHQLIQEYFAALFIAKQIQGDESFLATNYIDICGNSELLSFTCGHLASHDPRPVINYIANKEADKMLCDVGETGSVYYSLERLQSCYDESSLEEINPHLCIYPSCGYPLSNAIQSSKLVVINGVNESDPLKLQTSSVPVIISFDRRNTYHDVKEVGRLMKALSSAHINLLGIDGVLCDEKCKLGNFSQLKSIYYDLPNNDILDKEKVRDLTDSINAWGSEPKLRVLVCVLPYISDRTRATVLYIPLIQALSKCIHLTNLGMAGGNPDECIPALMGAPPPELKKLLLASSSKMDNVLESMTRAVRKKKLQKLELLSILTNHTSNAALTSLVKAFIGVRPDQHLLIVVDKFPPELTSLCKSTKITIIDSFTHLAALSLDENILLEGYG